MLPSLFRQVGTKGCQAVVLQGEYNIELWDDVLRKCILAEDPSGLLRAVLLDEAMPEQHKRLQRSDHRWQKANLDCVVFLQATLSTQCLYVVIGMEDASMMYKRLLHRYSVDVSNHSADLMLSLLNIRQQDKQDIQTYLANIDKQFAVCRFHDVVPAVEERMKSLIDGLSPTYSTYRDALKQQMHIQVELVKNGKLRAGEAYEHIVKCILMLHQRKRFDILVKNESVNLPKAPKEDQKWWQSASTLMPITKPLVKEEDKTFVRPYPPPAPPVIVNCLLEDGDGTKGVKEVEKSMAERELDSKVFKDGMDRMMELLETKIFNLRQLKYEELSKDILIALRKEFTKQGDSSDVEQKSVDTDKAEAVELKEQEEVEIARNEEDTKAELDPETADQPQSQQQSEPSIEAKEPFSVDIENINLSSKDIMPNNAEVEQIDGNEDKESSISKTVERVESKETFDSEESIITQVDETPSNDTLADHGSHRTTNRATQGVKEVVDLATNMAEEFKSQDEKIDSTECENGHTIIPAEKEGSMFKHPDNQIDQLSLDREKTTSNDQWQNIDGFKAHSDPLSDEELVEQLMGKMKAHQENEKDELVEVKPVPKENGVTHPYESKDTRDTKEIENYLLQTGVTE
ncbi:uncharacterized protein FA14DRAFT_186179 [Meira miltonrushii]|uniref:Uncharacterized protein n=1 Tax=Meira miltonrushii TaxID=1280837 RepID=A0A316V3K8_9BASI|nr:uncharacterized protein FA14DRAFT_186179 [Meira miltonrushii]PWN31578.1 hypothetical protein FA14DRAFT_186179 [Meira miltonrushii]